MRTSQQFIKIVKRTVLGIDTTVVRYIVAKILLRALEERTDPDRIYTQAGNVIEPAGYTRKITNAIVIGILV